MRVSAPLLIAIGAIAVLVAIGVTDQVLPATDARTAELRPWIAARALGVMAYLLLALEVATGLVLSHPRNTAAWRKTKQVFPWHELLTVFTFGFLAIHGVLLAVDRYANVGWLGALVPGLSAFRTPAIALGTVAAYTMLFTAITAKWTRLLPSGWWLKVHRVAALTFLMTWLHAVLSGTDGWGRSCRCTSSPACRSSPASSTARGRRARARSDRPQWRRSARCPSAAPHRRQSARRNLDVLESFEAASCGARLCSR